MCNYCLTICYIELILKIGMIRGVNMTDIKQKITLGGQSQKIHIRTRDESLPVLLFFHGGPGVCERHSTMKNDMDLMDTFTIATWDQRGSGGSYRGTKPETLTVDRLVEDANELVLWLCERFKKDKIFIIGGSWGLILGTLLACRHPEHIAAYVGFGQVVNIPLNEEISFNFALEAAKSAGDSKAVKALESVGPPVRGCYRGGFDGMMAQRRIMMKYGGYSQDAKKRSYFSSFVLPMFTSGEYSPAELYGIIKGYKFVLKAMWDEVAATDFSVTCTKFNVPVYIFDGRLDMNTPAELVEDWYNQIEAPDKCLIWFDESGHNPVGDEPEKFKKLLREKLLAVKSQQACMI